MEIGGTGSHPSTFAHERMGNMLAGEMLLINLENFVEAGFNVPVILVRGLEVADKVVNKDKESEGE